MTFYKSQACLPKSFHPFPPFSSINLHTFALTLLSNPRDLFPAPEPSDLVVDDAQRSVSVLTTRPLGVLQEYVLVIICGLEPMAI